MKKLLALLLVVALTFCLCGCESLKGIVDSYFEKQEDCPNLEKEVFNHLTGYNYSKFTLTNISEYVKVSVDREDLGEGAIYYTATLESGEVKVYYESSLSSDDLFLFGAKAGEDIASSGGYVEGDRVEIAIEIVGDTPVNGVIEIWFDKDR